MLACEVAVGSFNSTLLSPAFIAFSLGKFLGSALVMVLLHTTFGNNGYVAVIDSKCQWSYVDPSFTNVVRVIVGSSPS